jgi:hypothetical protein
VLTNVSVDGHEIPEWAQCYCCTRHVPMYTHPIPFFVPDGQVLYLCPTTHHSVNMLLKIYNQLGGKPELRMLNKFNHFSQRLAKLCWYIEQEDKKFLAKRKKLEREHGIAPG